MILNEREMQMARELATNKTYKCIRLTRDTEYTFVEPELYIERGAIEHDFTELKEGEEQD